MKETKFMAILNLTPDSFSDGGLLYDGELKQRLFLERVGQVIEDGAEILDLGGESTGPGSVEVSLEEELRRVIPALRLISQHFPGVKISIDTWKSEVAEAAIQAGGHWINDVTAGRGDERIFEVAARHKVPMVLMYSKDLGPRTTRENVEYGDVMKTVLEFLKERRDLARSYGVAEIILDPGMGSFVSGNPDYSFEILERIEELNELACPILLGTSRKGFLGEDRFGATLWTTTFLQGRVDYLRVHDVLENVSVVAELS